MLRRHSVFLASLVVLLTAHAAHSVETKRAPESANAKASKPASPASREQAKPASGDLPIPDGPALNVLIRRTLLSINDANLSGNYSVLRDLAAPDFQAANNQAALVGIFADLRNRKIDFAPILMYDPKLVRQPEIDAAGMLHLSGFVPTQPEQVNFDLLFQNVSGHWRMFGVALNTSRPQTSLSPAAGR